MPHYILAPDQGTISSRAILCDRDGTVAGSAHKEFGRIFPVSGWVEHDPLEIWSTRVGVTSEAIRSRKPGPRRALRRRRHFLNKNRRPHRLTNQTGSRQVRSQWRTSRLCQKQSPAPGRYRRPALSARIPARATAVFPRHRGAPGPSRPG